MIYVNCPFCGHKLTEGGTGSIVQIKCRKCGRIIGAAITQSKIVLREAGRQTAAKG